MDERGCEMKKIKVWDLQTRIFHWSLVVFILCALVTADMTRFFGVNLVNEDVWLFFSYRRRNCRRDTSGLQDILGVLRSILLQIQLSASVSAGTLQVPGFRKEEHQRPHIPDIIRRPRGAYSV